MREMRSSAIFLGAVLGPLRAGGAELSRRLRAGSPSHRSPPFRPAGRWGRRSDDVGGVLQCKAAGAAGNGDRTGLSLRGRHGESRCWRPAARREPRVISNAAREPEIVDLQNFLNACGAAGLRCGKFHRVHPWWAAGSSTARTYTMHAGPDCRGDVSLRARPPPVGRSVVRARPGSSTSPR